MENAYVSRARGGRMAVFGDSYSAGATDARGNSDGPVMPVEKRWWRYVAEALGHGLGDVDCYARNGAGFGGMEPGNTFAAQLAVAPRGDDVTTVLLAGGRNDGHPGWQRGDVRALCGAWLDEAAAKFPAARIIVIPFLWDCGLWRMNADHCRNRRAMLDALASWAHPERLIVVPGAWQWLWGVREAYGCYLHPNELGHRLLGAHAVSALRGGGIESDRAWRVPVDEPWGCGESVFRFSGGCAAWELDVALRGETALSSGATLGCPVAAPDWMDLPEAWGEVLAIGSDGGVLPVVGLVGVVAAQADATGDPDANPRKTAGGLRVVNRGVGELHLPAGARLRMRTTPIPLMG